MRSRLLVLAVSAAVIAGGIGVSVLRPTSDHVYLGELTHHDLSAPLRTMAAEYQNHAGAEASVGEAPEVEGESEAAEEARRALTPRPRSAAPTVDTVRQSVATRGRAMPAVGMHLAGIGANGYAPPDTSLDVGETQVVEAVNVRMQVWDKAGNSLLGPQATNVLFFGFGGQCESSNSGDATVVYDRLAKRWVVSQFAVSSTPYLQCIAVSQTSDALGSWYRYSFAYSFFPDYPKLAVWPDAYYTTFNGFTSSGGWYGGVVCAYDRAAMLQGLTAKQACYTNPLYGGMLVAGVEGSATPAAGTDAYAIALGDTNSELATWRFSPSFTDTPTLAVTGPDSVTVATYNLPCSGSGGNCVPQPGTNNRLDTLGERLMYRYVYRKIAGQESLLVSHSVADATSGVTGVRWYELRGAATDTGTPTLYQQGTVLPDATYRWMPSISMDKVGNIGMVYSVSSSSMYPSIAVTGRLSGDTLGVMTQAESIVVAGTGSQTSSQGRALTRWGDYAAAVVDPVDDCTFWVASEYLATTGAFNWKTGIANFTYPSCSGGAVGSAPVVQTQPTNATVTEGAVASFTAAASGSPTPTVQWQSQPSGGSWSNIGGATAATYTTPVTTAAMNGTKYRAVFTNATSPYADTTTAATLTVLRVQSALTLTPAATSVPANTTITLGSSGGSGTGALTYSVTGTGCSITSGNVLGTSTAGSCIAKVTKASDGIYASATSATITYGFTAIAQATLTISNTTLSFRKGTKVTLTTAGGSGSGAVTFSVTGTGCSVSGSTLTSNRVSTCSVTARKAASGWYLATTSAAKSFSFT